MAAEFHMRGTGPSSDTAAMPKARDYLLLQKREGRGPEGCHRERERAGMGSSLPGPSALYKQFIAVDC